MPLLPASIAAIVAASTLASAGIIIRQDYNDPPGGSSTHALYCPGGYTVISGGVAITDNIRNYISESFPADDNRGWIITTAPIRSNRDPRTVTVYAVCIRNFN